MNKSYQKKIRIYYKENIQINNIVKLSSIDKHYLKNVMRCKVGSHIYLYNENNGQFEARILEYLKENVMIKILLFNDFYEEETDLFLIFSPVKKNRNEFIIQKATELGVSEIYPVITNRNLVKTLNYDRLCLIAKEASEQSERLTIPKIHKLQKLEKLIDNWINDRIIIYADETIKSENYTVINKFPKNSKGAVLIGPEGGFSEKEINFLKSMEFIKPVSFGRRILKSDTSCIVALSFWHFLVSLKK